MSLVCCPAKYARADNRDMLEYIAKQLLEKETLDEKEFEALMRDVRIQRGEEVEIIEDENVIANTEENTELTENNGEESNG